MRVVVFDLDGTLVDTTRLILNSYVETIRLLGGTEVTTDDVLSNFNIGPTAVILERYLGRAISSQDLEAYYVAYETAISGLQPFPHVEVMLQQLNSKGYRLGLLTTATRRAVSLVLSQTGLDAHFGAIVAGDEIPHCKPAPDGLKLVCRRLGVRTGEAVYVGDAELDLACARRARVLGIQAGWGNTPAILTRDQFVASQPNEAIALIEGLNNEVYK